MIHERAALLALASSLALTLGCESSGRITETGPPQEGASVTARVVSRYGIDDPSVGIPLPSGLQVFVTGPDLQPVTDATVTVYPGGTDPQPMAHQGLGRYELDVLSGRLETVEDEYFFEVVSEWLNPERTVLRVPHQALTERPWFESPTERSEHVRNENLVLRWVDVPNADCYDVGTRRHDLEGWEPREECLADTFATVPADQANGFAYIRVRALHEQGDETFATERYFSRSVADAQVRIYFIDEEE